MLGGVSQSVYIASPEGMTGKSIVAFGLLEALASRSDRVGVYRPVVRSSSTRDYAVDLLIGHPAVEQSYEDAIGVDHQLVLSDPDTAHERILARHRELAERYSVLVVLGSDYDDLANPTELAFNAEVAANMGAPVVVVLSGLDRSPDQIGALAAVAVGEFGGHHAMPLAVVVNRAEADSLGAVREAVAAKVPGALVAAIPENPVIMAPTIQQLKDAVDGTLLMGSPEWLERVSVGTVVAAMSLPNVLTRLTENCTVIAPGDRYDLLPGLVMAQQSGTFPSLAGIVLTGGYEVPAEVDRLISGVQQDLPIIASDLSTFDTAVRIARARGRLDPSSPQKLDAARREVAEHLPTAELLSALEVSRSEVVTPMMFEFELLARARGAKKTIVLPEGEDPRIIAAAEAILARGVSPRRSTAAPEATTTAEAPSVSEEEFPAVTTPPGRTTGLSPASTSAVVPGRGPSSASTVCTAPLRPFTSTGTISSRKAPDSIAARARSWDRTAKASASSRAMPSTAASSSAVSGME